MAAWENWGRDSAGHRPACTRAASTPFCARKRGRRSLRKTAHHGSPQQLPHGALREPLPRRGSLRRGPVALLALGHILTHTHTRVLVAAMPGVARRLAAVAVASRDVLPRCLPPRPWCPCPCTARRRSPCPLSLSLTNYAFSPSMASRLSSAVRAGHRGRAVRGARHARQAPHWRRRHGLEGRCSGGFSSRRHDGEAERAVAGRVRRHAHR